MEKLTREITLDEAKNLYNANDEINVFLLSKFTKEELEGKTLPSQEEFNKFFENTICPLIDMTEMNYLTNDGYSSQTPTGRIELNNSNGNWLFDYDYDQKNPHFWCSYTRVYYTFNMRFSLQEFEFIQLMKNVVETRFKLTGVTPEIYP
jgi:hypothetical protein